MFVVGTAGHVDHGKSTLVQALTGIDPDRLKEEKVRGMTIDLGFAWMRLPSGREVSLVDVPGHERFVKNMLAGVGGIDLALLVVAADEGVMPQTREHLAILDLLGIRSGVVAITKADLVEQDWLDLVMVDVVEVLAGTGLEGSPLVPCSAVTRSGLPELIAALESRLERTEPKRDLGRPRLWIDRAFTISGFGTVVTGTLIDGSLKTGQDVELLAEGRRARVRTIQMHRQKVDRVSPGTRTALNLAGVATGELQRGMLLTTPGWLESTTAADVRLRAVSDLRRPLRHNASVTFHTGSAEVPAKIRLLDRSELESGDSCWAQVRLAKPLPLVKGDAFVVRNPNATIGGGSIVDSHPRRHRRNHAPTLSALAVIEQGEPTAVFLGFLAKLEPASAGSLAREAGIAAASSAQLVERLVAERRIVQLGDGQFLYTVEGYQNVLNEALQLSRRFLADHRLRMGMPREELKSRLGLPQKLFNELVARWLTESEIGEAGSLITLPGQNVVLSAAEEAAAARFLSDLRKEPFAPTSDSVPAEDLLAFLAERGDIVQAADGIHFSREAFEMAREKILGHFAQHSSITLAEARDLLGTSRRYAQALLEHLDEVHLTRRIGDERVLRAPEATKR